MFDLFSEIKVLVQGITGNQGSFHARKMVKFGTKIVAGVTPGKKGEKVAGIPVFNTVAEAQRYQKANFSVVFVPAKFVKEAAFEALTNDLNLVIISEGVPVFDSLQIINKAKEKGLTVIGPNCPGFVIPGKIKLGIIPDHIFKKGGVAIVSRSGTLTYEVVSLLTQAGIGQSIALGIGGDLIPGTDFIEALRFFNQNSQVKKIILVGEIGGDAEELAADYLKKNLKKRVIAYIAGRTAPEGKTMGHAGAIITSASGKAVTKIKALRSAGVIVANLVSEIPKLV